MRKIFEKIKLHLHLSRLKKVAQSEVIELLGEQDFSNAILKSYTLDEKSFEAWIKTSDYHGQFPKYVEEFGEPRQPKGVLEGKFAEHYISTMLGSLEKLKKDDIIIDVAASNSPFKEILINKGFDNTFRTDLNFTTNLERNEIGSSADDLSFFSDSSVSLIVSHNSVEHFEGDADIGFLKEAARVLKPNSAVVWIPLVMAKGGVNHTDPSVWATKYRNAPIYPVFDKRFPVQFGTHKQRLMKFFDPKVLDEDLGKIKELKFDVVELENGKRGNKFALVGTKN